MLCLPDQYHHPRDIFGELYAGFEGVVQNFSGEDDNDEDSYTRYISGKPLRTKDQATDALVEIINMLEIPSTTKSSKSRSTGEANSGTRMSESNLKKLYRNKCNSGKS